jgi:threonine aldolase
MQQQFASDNNAGLCPAAMAALERANGTGHAPGYGDDRWTREATDRIRVLLDAPTAQVFFVFNGTAANSLALAALCRPYHATICHASSHVATDECGAPGFFSGGMHLLTADGDSGKLDPLTVDRLATARRDVHSQPARALSITQATEFGTVYTLNELIALGAAAKRHGLKFHMDGARFANAVAALGCHPAAMTWRAGVDVLSLGGTKNGLAVGEAVVFFDETLAEDFAWRVKQSGQLASKMRFVTAPWIGLLDGDVWLANAAHANAMARRLSQRLAGLPGVRLMFPVEANAVFAEIPEAAQVALRGKGWYFYTFIGATGCRLMCAWDTEAETVDRFVDDLAAVIPSA